MLGREPTRRCCHPWERGIMAHSGSETVTFHFRIRDQRGWAITLSVKFTDSDVTLYALLAR